MVGPAGQQSARKGVPKASSRANYRPSCGPRSGPRRTHCIRQSRTESQIQDQPSWLEWLARWPLARPGPGGRDQTLFLAVSRAVASHPLRCMRTLPHAPPLPPANQRKAPAFPRNLATSQPTSDFLPLGTCFPSTLGIHCTHCTHRNCTHSNQLLTPAIRGECCCCCLLLIAFASTSACACPAPRSPLRTLRTLRTRNTWKLWLHPAEPSFSSTPRAQPRTHHANKHFSRGPLPQFSPTTSTKPSRLQLFLRMSRPGAWILPPFPSLDPASPPTWPLFPPPLRNHSQTPPPHLPL